MGDLHWRLETTHCGVCGCDFPSQDALFQHERAIHPGAWS